MRACARSLQQIWNPARQRARARAHPACAGAHAHPTERAHAHSHAGQKQKRAEMMSEKGLRKLFNEIDRDGGARLSFNSASD